MTDIAPRPPVVPLDDQIAALRRAIDGKASSLEFQVTRKKIAPAAAAAELDKLEAAMRTLNWVRNHGDACRAWWAARQKFEAERAADLAALDAGDGV